MLTHSEWLSNRGYIQHLSVLRRIKQKPSELSPTSNQVHPLPSTPPQHIPQTPNRTQRTHPYRPQSNSPSIRNQRILWENYHLGRRIIETSPVISKRHLDKEYLKHQKLLKGLSTTSLSKTNCSEFRLRKLHEHQNDIDLIDEGGKIKRKSGKGKGWYLLMIIEKIVWNYGRENGGIEDLKLIMRYSGGEGNEENLDVGKTMKIEMKDKQYQKINLEKEINGKLDGKKTFKRLNRNQFYQNPQINHKQNIVSKKPAKCFKQTSECLPYSSLSFHHYYFNLPRKHLYAPITIELINVKGLLELSSGYFTFKFLESDRNSLIKRVSLFHCGSIIGEVFLQAYIGNKNGIQPESNIDETSENSENKLSKTHNEFRQSFEKQESEMVQEEEEEEEYEDYTQFVQRPPASTVPLE